MKKYAMSILGCKVNDYEATYVKENMNKYYEEVSFKDIADIYIIFTCCVTNAAEAKTRKFIHDARRNNPNSFICAVGCLCQTKNNDEVFDDVDLIVGSDHKKDIADLINLHEKNNIVKDKIDTAFEELYINSYPGKSRSFLKIQDGCNQFCTYCIIPYSRGRERSGNHVSLLQQAKVLSNTTNEIVLTGIHTGRYNDDGYKLYDLLRDLLKIEKLQTIRLSSIELTEINDEIIDLIKNDDRIAHHLHVPIQSCSDIVLKHMNRPYSYEEFYNRICYIREQIPDISISTDLIVGFPYESDEEFNIVLRRLKEISFNFIHVFPYSRKKGTKADTFDNHIDPKVKKARVKQIIELSKKIKKEMSNSYVGKKVKILIENYDGEYSYGYSKQYVYCKLKGQYEIGDIIEIELKKENIYET